MLQLIQPDQDAGCCVCMYIIIQSCICVPHGTTAVQSNFHFSLCKHFPPFLVTFSPYNVHVNDVHTLQHSPLATHTHTRGKVLCVYIHVYLYVCRWDLQRARALLEHQELLKKYNKKSGGGEQVQEKKDKTASLLPKLEDSECFHIVVESIVSPVREGGDMTIKVHTHTDGKRGSLPFGGKQY